MMTRRSWLTALGAALVLPWSRSAHATTARAVGLPELVRTSSLVLSGVARSATCTWESVGKQRRIVTYTVVSVDEALLGEPGAEVLVRTLGGQVDKIGQIVHGEATLTLGERAVLFLEPIASGALRVTAMAQGHYPLRADAHGELRLQPSPSLDHLATDADSAVTRLRDLRVGEAERAAREARDAH